MFGWTVHWKGYVPAARAGTWYWRVATPGKTSPLNLTAPVESLISTSCGVEASWLSNSITNGLSAGAVSAVGSYLMPDAVSLTTVALASPEAPGDPDAVGEPDGVAPLGAGDP